MPRRNSGTRAAGRKSKTNLVWTAVTTFQNLIGAAIEEFPVVTGSDWFGAAGGRGTATLMSIRGWISLAGITNTSTVVAMTLIKVDKDLAAGGPRVAGTYVEDDILWTGGWNKPGDLQQFAQFDINVKARRKLSSDDTIVLAVSAVDASATEISLVLRGLMMLNNG